MKKFLLLTIISLVAHLQDAAAAGAAGDERLLKMQDFSCVIDESPNTEAATKGISVGLREFGFPGTQRVGRPVMRRANTSDILLEEGFETSVPPEGWTVYDGNGDGYNWSWSFSPVHTGSGMAYSDSYIPGPFGGYYNPDNWLITPKLSIPADGVYRLSFWIGYGNPQLNADKYGVFISTTDNSPESFTELYSETVHNNPGSQYYDVELSLAEYAGRDIYIAFRHYDSADGGQKLLLDDVVVDKIPAQPVFSGASSVNFGQVYDINPDKKATYTIVNAGTEPLVITPGNSSAEIMLEGASITIDPRSSADISVLLNTSNVGNYSGAFSLNTNDPDAPSVSISVAAEIVEATLTDFHFECFEEQSYEYPLGWMPAFFNKSAGGGINNSGAYVAGLSNGYGAQFTTHYVNLGDDPIVSFYYKAINSDGTPTKAEELMFGVYISDNFGATDYTPVYIIEPGSGNEHKPSADFQLIEIPLPEYAGKICNIGFTAFSANGASVSSI